MNISNQIQIIFVPFWLRVLTVLIVLAIAAICGFMFYSAIADGNKPDWIAAAAYLLGIVFPFIILFAILLGGSFGESSIRRRTETMLRGTIPYTLQFIPEDDRHFEDFKNGNYSRKIDDTNLAQVSVHHSDGRCYADYLVSIEAAGVESQIALRVELNIKRANINFMFEQQAFAALKAGFNFSGSDDKFIWEKFKHSLAVEALQSKQVAQLSEQTHSTKPTAYTFNPRLIPRTIDNKQYVALVASTSVSDDLVWNPAERVFFAQDLTFMIKAFWQECPEFFLKNVQ